MSKATDTTTDGSLDIYSSNKTVAKNTYCSYLRISLILVFFTLRISIFNMPSPTHVPTNSSLRSSINSVTTIQSAVSNLWSLEFPRPCPLRTDYAVALMWSEKLHIFLECVFSDNDIHVCGNIAECVVSVEDPSLLLLLLLLLPICYYASQILSHS